VQAHEDLELVPQPLEHRDLVVRREAGQHPGSVVVVEELAAHFEVELPADLLAALLDVAGLQLDVLLAIEPDPCAGILRGGGGGRGRGAGVRSGHPGTLAPRGPTRAVPGVGSGRWSRARARRVAGHEVRPESTSIRIDEKLAIGATRGDDGGPAAHLSPSSVRAKTSAPPRYHPIDDPLVVSIRIDKMGAVPSTQRR